MNFFSLSSLSQISHLSPVLIFFKNIMKIPVVVRRPARRLHHRK
jgi:hypothetical protein